MVHHVVIPEEFLFRTTINDGEGSVPASKFHESFGKAGGGSGLRLFLEFVAEDFNDDLIHGHVTPPGQFPGETVSIWMFHMKRH